MFVIIVYKRSPDLWLEVCGPQLVWGGGNLSTKYKSSPVLGYKSSPVLRNGVGLG